MLQQIYTDAYQERLDWPVMLEATNSVCLLLLLHRPVPESHARSCVMAHLVCMICPAPGYSL